MKNIFIITTARSEFGILKNIIIEVSKIKKIKLTVIASGTHLISKYGKTINEINKLKLKNLKKIKIQVGDTSSQNSIKIASNLMKKFSKLFEKDKPDCIVVFGDRFEILAISYVSFLYKIPIIHIGGGETTMGSSDESIRHSVSKLSSFHFVTHKEHKKRLIQLGENKKNIHIIGSPGIENIKKTKVLKKKEVEKRLGFKFLRYNIVVNFYPLTNEKNKDEFYINQLLNSLSSLKNTRIIFTFPAFDIGSDIILKRIKLFVKNHKNTLTFKSLGSENYFSILKYSNLVIGNSSSGLIEAPIIGTKVINIGDRQKNRIKPKEIIDVPCKSKEIKNAINLVMKKNIMYKNIYPNIKSSKKFAKILSSLKLHHVLKKKFFDLKF